MVHSPPTDTRQDEAPANLPALNSMTRRELITTGGKLVVAAAVSSAFSPFTINVKAAPVKHFLSGSSMAQGDRSALRANGLRIA